MGQVLHTIDRIPSTQSWAKAELVHASTSSQDTHIFWANEQTHGYGRDGRSWHSTTSSWTCTVALPVSSLQPTSLWPLWAGYTLIQTLQKFWPLRLQLKWPNDLLWQHKKLAGLLTELHGPSNHLLVGLGLNIGPSPEDFPTELQSRIASVPEAYALGTAPMAVLQQWLEHLRHCLHHPPSVQVLTPHLWGLGQTLEWMDGDLKKQQGHFLGLNAQGGLQMRTTEGAIQTFWFGEIQKLRDVNTSILGGLHE